MTSPAIGAWTVKPARAKSTPAGSPGIPEVSATFWARGEKGGELVGFEFGTLAAPKKFFDTGKGKLEKVALAKDWQHYEIDVSAQDLTRIKTGFVWTLASPGAPITFYLDDIRWE